MIIGLGCDLASIKKTSQLLEKYGERFLKKVFTEQEIERGTGGANPGEEFASWFSAKEATQKALGAGIFGGIRFREIEIISHPSGAPKIQLQGRAKKRAEQIGVKAIHLSLSHEQDYALAVVVLEGGER